MILIWISSSMAPSIHGTMSGWPRRRAVMTRSLGVISCSSRCYFRVRRTRGPSTPGNACGCGEGHSIDQGVAFLDGAIGVRAVEVGADFVGEFLRDRRSAHSDDYRVAQTGPL